LETFATSLDCAKPSMAQERVLVLEDNADLREQTCDILVEAGYSVASASSGAEAIAAAQNDSFDLLIADVHVPDMSGIEAFARIRAIHPDVAGVALTGYRILAVSTDALRAGLAGFLVKPVVPAQCVAAVVAALAAEVDSRAAAA